MSILTPARWSMTKAVNILSTLLETRVTSLCQMDVPITSTRRSAWNTFPGERSRLFSRNGFVYYGPEARCGSKCRISCSRVNRC